MSSRAELRKKVLEIINTPPPDDLSKSFVEAPDAFKSALSRGTVAAKGYPIPGFERLSHAVGGLREKGFTVLCGPTGAGKTTLLANLWVNFVENRFPIFTAPVENGKEDFIDMCVSIVSQKNRLTLTSQDWEEVRKNYAPKYFSDRRNVFSTHESRVNHIDLLTEIYHAHLTKGVRLALCDNWQFMLDVKKGGDFNFESDKAFHECIVFSKHIPVHILMVMHPKKTDGGRIESELDIKGSSNSVQEAHSVLLFNRLKDEKDAPPLQNATFCREIKVAKARYNGRSVGSKIIYSLDPVCEQYKEYKLI